MKILLASDIHNSQKPFHGRDESKNMVNFIKVISQEKPNLIIVAGDTEDPTNAEIEKLRVVCEQLDANVYFIIGNHDYKEKQLKETYNIDGSSFLLPDEKFIEYKNITIAGIHGLSVTLTQAGRKKYRFSFEEQTEKAKLIKASLAGRKLDFLVAHEFPRLEYLSDEEPERFYKTRSTGILTDIIDLLKPKTVVTGHLHGYHLFETKYNDIQILNLAAFTDGYYVIMQENESVKEKTYKKSF